MKGGNETSLTGAALSQAQIQGSLETDCVIVDIHVVLEGKPGTGPLPASRELPAADDSCSTATVPGRRASLTSCAADFVVTPASLNSLPINHFREMTARAAAAAESAMTTKQAATRLVARSSGGRLQSEVQGDSFASRMAGKRLAPAGMPLRPLTVPPPAGARHGSSLIKSKSAGDVSVCRALPRVRSEQTMAGRRQQADKMTDLQRLSLIAQLVTGGRPLDEAMRDLRARSSAFRSSSRRSSLPHHP